MTKGERIREARKNAHMTQEELGRKLGVSGSMIAQYETGKRNPKEETMKRIAAALGAELRSPKEEPPPEEKPVRQIRVHITPESREFSDLMAKHDAGTITLEETARLLELGENKTEEMMRVLADLNRAFVEIMEKIDWLSGFQSIGQFRAYFPAQEDASQDAPAAEDES